MLTPWKESYDQPRQHIGKWRDYFTNKDPCSQGYGFSSGHVWMWELDCEESWALKHWCFWTVVLEKTLESPLDCKEVQLVHSEGDQSWVFIGRTDAKAETPILWPPHAKSWLIGKDFDAGRDWGREEKGTTEDEITRTPNQHFTEKLSLTCLHMHIHIHSSHTLNLSPSETKVLLKDDKNCSPICSETFAGSYHQKVKFYCQTAKPMVTQVKSQLQCTQQGRLMDLCMGW